MDKQEFENYLKKIPKAEIHVHIEAVITLDTVKKLYKNRFEKEMSQEEQDSLFSYEDLNGFIQSFLKVQDLLDYPDVFSNILVDYFMEYGTYISQFVRDNYGMEEDVKLYYEFHLIYFLITALK